MGNKAKIREEAKKLVPMDDIMFRKMAEEKGFCQEILQVILGDPGLVVVRNQPQFPVTNLQGRSVILDAHCALSNGREVDVEVQKSNDDDHQRRVRYNGAVLTANIMDPGERFEKVPDVYVVFISRFDIFKSGLPLYHVDRMVRETGKVVSNGVEEVYVNAAVKDGSDISELMDVFVSQDRYNDKFPFTSASKRRYRETEEGQEIMCEIMEKLNTEAREEGRREGHREGRRQGRKEGRRQGRKEGHGEGRNEMQEELNALNIRLINENRLDDLRKAATDIVYQSQLLKELFPKKAH